MAFNLEKVESYYKYLIYAVEVQGKDSKEAEKRFL